MSDPKEIDRQSIPEIQRLNSIASDSWYTLPTAVATIEYSYQVFRRYFPRSLNRVLEIGPAEGTMTKLLINDGIRPDILEGSTIFAENLRQQFPDLQIYNSLIESFQPTCLYDLIILGHVLEHVDDPVLILSTIRNWIVPKTGLIMAAVPNARSIHRQAAVIMGLIPHEETMSEKDVHHGHRRIYTPETFRRDFTLARLTIEFFGGYWLKPLSDRQLEASWTPEMLHAFMKLGERYPDIAAELVIVAKKDY
ncbi:class I SAM-dependent methyltransferase [Thermosynechococcus sp. HN-54]|uniref:class I SAM-dependent methyltransferase n=1 Tax=Thermosynechococcus sp. HN-54 TaxID=2933959 RepID=UPI00202CFC3C|nr:methyltransferase domain-containing protein [Thermosynechococcus sp. HN-54]URR35476.1 class I SAM-dependent methyltransferase [Thermosynechococcus sp. HN-54]